MVSPLHTLVIVLSCCLVLPVSVNARPFLDYFLSAKQISSNSKRPLLVYQNHCVVSMYVGFGLRTNCGEIVDGKNKGTLTILAE